MAKLIKKGKYKEHNYEIKEHTAEWSEDPVKYYIYDSHNHILKADECESHLALDFIKADIDKLINFKVSNVHI